MNKYLVGYRTRDNKYMEKIVFADTIERDSHWVTFYRSTPPKEDVFHGSCDNCGRTTVRPRLLAPTRTVVAVYPAPLICLVEIMSEEP